MNLIDKGTVFTLTHIDNMSEEYLEHKDYFDRIELGNGKYRYFYSRESLRSYINQATAEGHSYVGTTERGTQIPIMWDDVVESGMQQRKKGLKKTISRMINSIDDGSRNPEVFKKK